jgi:AcrR family transcriptional regulator
MFRRALHVFNHKMEQAHIRPRSEGNGNDCRPDTGRKVHGLGSTPTHHTVNSLLIYWHINRGYSRLAVGGDRCIVSARLIPKRRRAGTRAGLTKRAIILRASAMLEAEGAFPILRLAKKLGVVPATILFHFKGGHTQIITEIARQSVAGAARPFRPSEDPEDYLHELFWRVGGRLSRQPAVAQLVAVELSLNPVLEPALAERLLAVIVGLGAAPSDLPRYLARVTGRLVDMILAECARTDESKRLAIADQIFSTLETLDPDEHELLTQFAGLLVRHARAYPRSHLTRKVSDQYAGETVEMLRSQIGRRAPARDAPSAPVDEKLATKQPDIFG